MTAVATSSSPPARVSAGPLGPGGHLWECAGQGRNILLLAYTGVLQAMHPAIGTALTTQSTAFTDPWSRLWRSSHEILGSIYDDDAESVGRRVRDYHTGVQGTLPDGSAYHALNPGPFVWAHTTFVWSMIVAADTFGTPLTPAQCEQAWAEGLQWYARYGMGGRLLPQTWVKAQAYVERVVREELTHVDGGAAALRSISVRTACPFERLPQAVWDRIGVPFGRLEIWVAAGLFPPVLRERLCLSWTRRDAVAFAVLRRVVRLVAAAVPRRHRYLPRAAAAWRRQAG